MASKEAANLKKDIQGEKIKVNLKKDVQGEKKNIGYKLQYSTQH